MTSGARRSTTRVVLIRHGESLWNAEGRMQGQQGTGLSRLGAAQAELTAAALARAYPDAALIARSDLQRVAETAAPAEALIAAPVEVDERLREIHLGTWSGMKRADVATADADGLSAWMRGEDVRRGDGETFSELRERVWEALLALSEKVGEGTALVFTHGGPIRVAVTLALGLPAGGERRLAPSANCALTVLDLADEPRLRTYNEIGHLTVAVDSA